MTEGGETLRLVGDASQKCLCGRKPEAREVNLLRGGGPELVFEVQLLKAGGCAVGFTRLSPATRQTRWREIRRAGTEA